MLFEGFTLSMIELGEVTLRVRHGGSGPPLLLLHGHPQTHMMWHAIAPDLRGYGDSSKPATTPDHMSYSKHVMAQDQVALMQHFGFEQFLVAGHDRGGRCALEPAGRVAEMVRRPLDLARLGKRCARESDR